jgi:hypothetical protein
MATAVPVAQPQSAPHHQPKIKSEQEVREQWAADPQVRRHRTAEIAGEQDRAEDRGRRDGIEHRAHDGDDTKASRQRFARTVADPVHRFRDNRPRHQLDGAIEQQEYDNETAEKTAHPERGLRNRRGLSDRSHGSLHW